MKYLNFATRFAKAFFRNPAILIEAAEYFRKDMTSIIKNVDYPHKLIFIAGLPKSGTTWLENLLTELPGYLIRPYYDPNGKAKDHDIEDVIFEALPKNRYTVLKLHTRYSAENYACILRHVPKFIVMYRDLRDMCISRYYHVLNEPDHWQHEVLSYLDKESGIKEAIKVVEEHYVPWVRDWHRVTEENSDKIHIVKYESMHADIVSEVKKVLDIFGIKASDEYYTFVSSSKMKGKVELGKNIKKFKSSLKSDTRRKGGIGNWKELIYGENKEYFKQIAGDLLIETGYEEDLNW